MLKYTVFVVTITFKHTQNLLRIKTTTLLKFIKIYNKRKIVFVDNIRDPLFELVIRIQTCQTRIQKRQDHYFRYFRKSQFDVKFSIFERLTITL